MNAETVEDYEWWLNGWKKDDQQYAHQIRRRSFSAYLFHIIGNKHVLLSCIQHPICSAAQPAHAIRRLIDAWEKEKDAKKKEEKGDDEDKGPPPHGCRALKRTRRE